MSLFSRQTLRRIELLSGGSPEVQQEAHTRAPHHRLSVMTPEQFLEFLGFKKTL